MAAGRLSAAAVLSVKFNGRDMETVGNLEEASEKVFSDVKKLLEVMRSLTKSAPESVEEGIVRVAEIRECVYEELNQVQHEYLILEAANWLVANGRIQRDAEWSWNPRQTGGSDEPDLRAEVNGVTKISCEITTSRRPIGTIAERMKKTIAKLSEFEGSKFYFVRTEQMLKRAEKYISDNAWPIEAVCIKI